MQIYNFQTNHLLFRKFDHKQRIGNSKRKPLYNTDENPGPGNYVIKSTLNKNGIK